ncbi:serine/threonine protein kinase [Sphaerisporangium rhizosphaerae]|uniref:non-specific serine/threonine protein kinase n=1 Tax=Sphaerisporangium rhizosphaerae TaxID=2269375 RepID=A0ABW2NXE6_9ACTN
MQSLLPDDPKQVGAYTLLGRLGEGTRGVVYLGRLSGEAPIAAPTAAEAEAPAEAGTQGESAAATGTPAESAPSPATGEPGRLFVVKLLPPWPEAGDEARARVVDDLSAAQRVSSAYAVRSVDAGWIDDRAYVVREHVEGRSLREAVELDGPLTGDALERVAVGTLTALTAVHLAGIAHRGLTPDNVLLSADGPRVCDFGLGETAYRSPEQVRGEPTGPAADLFAWASTMVFAATGAEPFGEDAEAIATARADLGGLPAPLRDVVGSCLAKVPAERPTAQGAMLWLLGEEKAAPPAPAIPAAPVPGAPLVGIPVPGVPGASSSSTPTVPAGQAGPAGRPGPAGPAGDPPQHTLMEAGGSVAPPPAVVPQGTESLPPTVYAAEPQPPAPPVWGAPALPSEEPARPELPAAAGGEAPPAAPVRKRTGAHFPVGLAAGVGVVIGLSGLGLWGAGHYAGSSQQIGRVAAEGQAGGTNVPEPSGGLGDVAGVGESTAPRPQVTVPWAGSPAPQQTGVYPMQLTTSSPAANIPNFSPGPQFTPPPIPSAPPTPTRSSPTPVPTVTVTMTPSPVVSPSAEPTPTPSPSGPDQSPQPSVTPTPDPSGPGSPTPSPSPSGPLSLVPTPTPTPSPTPTTSGPASPHPSSPSPRPTPSVSRSFTPRPPHVWSPRPSVSARPTGTRTPAPRPTVTRTATATPAPKPATNPFTPQQVCNGSGKGTGFAVQRQSAFTGGVTYQLYNLATGFNCVVTMKTQNIGVLSPVSATLEVQGSAPVSESGSFKYYAGPVVMQGKGKCVRFSGSAGSGSTAAPFGNCG